MRARLADAAIASHPHGVERDGERVASDLYSLDRARTAVRADVRAYMED